MLAGRGGGKAASGSFSMFKITLNWACPIADAVKNEMSRAVISFKLYLPKVIAAVRELNASLLILPLNIISVRPFAMLITSVGIRKDGLVITSRVAAIAAAVVSPSTMACFARQ